ncbi:hypothetical protein AcV5_006329 [Taiwanofungus camphoratus]|nr:hypothetical protein AcW2_004768 [Antrodia cinnamomea]KAI0934506.1 hypothetical protein AcV5_006329 [Antrodia cinnamomea]
MSSELAGGRYVITNVRFRNIAFLADPNDGTPVTADVEQNRNGEKWNVTKLGNGKYQINNVSHASYANAGNRPASGATVQGRAQVEQWVIQETRVRGQYTISNSDTVLYWGLPDGQVSTLVSKLKNKRQRLSLESVLEGQSPDLAHR